MAWSKFFYWRSWFPPVEHDGYRYQLSWKSYQYVTLGGYMKKLFQNFHCWYFWSRKILSRGAISRDLWKWVSWEKSGSICTYICIGTEPVHFVTLTQKRIKKCQWIMIEIQDAVETIILVITVVTLNEDFFLSNLPAVTN